MPHLKELKIELNKLAKKNKRKFYRDFLKPVEVNMGQGIYF
jgi:hypothetical protein